MLINCYSRKHIVVYNKTVFNKIINANSGDHLKIIRRCVRQILQEVDFVCNFSKSITILILRSYLINLRIAKINTS